VLDPHEVLGQIPLIGLSENQPTPFLFGFQPLSQKKTWPSLVVYSVSFIESSIYSKVLYSFNLPELSGSIAKQSMTYDDKYE